VFPYNLPRFGWFCHNNLVRFGGFVIIMLISLLFGSFHYYLARFGWFAIIWFVLGGFAINWLGLSRFAYFSITHFSHNLSKLGKFSK